MITWISNLCSFDVESVKPITRRSVIHYQPNFVAARAAASTQFGACGAAFADYEISI